MQKSKAQRGGAETKCFDTKKGRREKYVDPGMSD